MKVSDICYGELVEIDELDRQILHCLAIDGRVSFSEIAAVLEVSDQTIARRYRRLRGAGVIRVVGLRAKQTMGSLGWVLHMRCVPGSAQPLAEGLARRTDTAWVQLLSGDTEVLCTVRGAAAERDAVLAKLPRGGRIVAVSAYRLLHIYVSVSGGLGFLRTLLPEQAAVLKRPVRDEMLEFGELDLALFRELGMEGRTSHADLAKAVGWSESTVRRRMEQLRDSGMLFYDLELDLPAFGYHAQTWLWLSVPPSELAATGKAIGEFPEVAYAAATTGAFNLLACAVCRDEEEFYEFLTTRVGSLRTVDRIETSPIIRVLKQSSTVLAAGLRAWLQRTHAAPPARSGFSRRTSHHQAPDRGQPSVRSGPEEQDPPADEDRLGRASQPQQCPEQAGKVRESPETICVPGAGAVLHGDPDAGQQKQPGHAVSHDDVKADRPVADEDAQRGDHGGDREKAEGGRREVQQQEHQEHDT
jgi:DNA-binding Lrp family transcriptional regulator